MNELPAPSKTLLSAGNYMSTNITAPISLLRLPHDRNLLRAMIPKKSFAVKLSRLVTGVTFLLSLLALSGYISANTDSNKTVTRETLVKRNLAAKRSISLQQAQQHLISVDFFRQGILLNVIQSQPQFKCLVRIRLYEQGRLNPDCSEIHQAQQLHAPRSAEISVNIS